MKAAHQLGLSMGLCLWASLAWAQQPVVEFLDFNTQHANDGGRGYVDLTFQTRGLPIGVSFLRYECSMQLNPFPNAGSVPLRCEGQPVVLPASVWEACNTLGNELIENSSVNYQRTWRIHAPIESRYTFQVRAVLSNAAEPSFVYSDTRTMFFDIITNPPQIKGPVDRRVSRCTDVRIPVRTESQPRVWYTRGGVFTTGEGDHAIGSPCYPHKVEFHVPLYLNDFHDDGFVPVEQPGWDVAPGKTIQEQIRLQDIWGGGPNDRHISPPPTRFSITCDPATPPAVRFLNPPPPDSPLPVAIFEFESDIVDATFQCALDNEAFQACTSPFHRDKLSAARHTFRVRAVNAVGVVGEPQTQTWQQNTIAGSLDVVLENPRNVGVQHSSLVAADGRAPSGTRLLVLVLASANLGGGFVAKCDLTADEQGSWRCPISKVLYDDNAYRAEVYAWNTNNHYASAGLTFAVNEATAFGRIDGNRRPRLFSKNGENSEGTTDLAFEVSWPFVELNREDPLDHDNNRLECRLDEKDYGPCGSYDPEIRALVYVIGESANTPGLHRIQVREKRSEANGTPVEPRNATPLEYVWFQQVDTPTDAFRPRISSPSKEGEWVGGSTLVLRGTAHPFFPLSVYLDGAEQPVCERVAVTPDGNWECAISELAEGEHSVTARIDVLPKDSNGNYWTSRSFGFLPPFPRTFITRRPSKHEQNAGATFEFASPRKQILRFECKLDTDEFKACTSPFEMSNLTQGAHEFQVRAIDIADQTEPEPATWNWTIGNLPPSSGCSGCTATTFSPAWAAGVLGLWWWVRRGKKK